jgi:hypothetical protein
MAWRGNAAAGCRRLGEQPGQQAVDEQPPGRRQRRTGRQARHAFGAGLVQAQQEALQVMALFFGQHRGRQCVQAKQTGQGGGRHAAGSEVAVFRSRASMRSPATRSRATAQCLKAGCSEVGRPHRRSPR